MSRDLIEFISALWSWLEGPLWFGGLVLLVVGVYRRKLDSHPHCARCLYDLTGRPADAQRCPECGADLQGRNAIVSGLQRRRRGLVVLALLIGVGAYLADQGVNALRRELFARPGRLLNAIGNDDVKTIDALLLDDPRLLQESFGPALYAAAVYRGGQDAALARLLKEPLVVAAVRNPDPRAWGSGSPLWSTLRDGSVQALEWVLQAGAAVDELDYRLEMPIHFAAEHRGGEIVNILVDHGADPLARDRRGLTPLHRCFSDWPGLTSAEALLKRGVPVDTRDAFGRTALHYAMQEGSYDAAWWLLSHGADITVIDIGGKTPSQLAMESEKGGSTLVAALWERLIRETVRDGHEERARALIRSSRDLWTTYPFMLTDQSTSRADDPGRPPELAIRVLTLLLEEGFPIDQPGANGRTLLHRAAGNNNGPAVRFLIVSGADPEARDKDGKTPRARWYSREYDTLVEEALAERATTRPATQRASARERE